MYFTLFYLLNTARTIYTDSKLIVFAAKLQQSLNIFTA